MRILSVVRSFIRLTAPPPPWRLSAIVASGTIIGLGLLSLHVGRATSYLTDRPEACVNCHVMVPQYATWQHGSHGRVTVCNDCHVPHENPLRTYLFKASDGTRHSLMFTFRLEPQVIRVKEAGIAVIQQNCIRCHEQHLGPVAAGIAAGASVQHAEGRLCWECHRETPHGRVSSLASAPNARVPQLRPVTPQWISKSLFPTTTSASQ